MTKPDGGKDIRLYLHVLSRARIPARLALEIILTWAIGHHV